MNRIEYLLTKLGEECVEVAQRCSKAACFGVDEMQPLQGYTNGERIMHELEDVRVILHMLQEEGVLPLASLDEERFAVKRAKVEKYMEYSRQRGALTDRPPAST